MAKFLASYESDAKAKAAATAAGWKDGESYADYVDVHADSDLVTAQWFADKAAAVAWLVPEINAMKTVFGCGDVVEFEPVPRADRCRYCNCNGWRRVSRAIVSDDGVEQEDSEDSDCVN